MCVSNPLFFFVNNPKQMDGSLVASQLKVQVMLALPLPFKEVSYPLGREDSKAVSHPPAPRYARHSNKQEVCPRLGHQHGHTWELLMQTNQNDGESQLKTMKGTLTSDVLFLHTHFPDERNISYIT